jgi:hypothetical protein
LSLSSYDSADLSSPGSVAWGLQRGKVGSLLWSLAQCCGPSGLAPIRPYVDLLNRLSLPRPTKEWPYELLGPWAFREVFYSSSGPGGYLSPTSSAKTRLPLHSIGIIYPSSSLHTKVKRAHKVFVFGPKQKDRTTTFRKK